MFYYEVTKNKAWKDFLRRKTWKISQKSKPMSHLLLAFSRRRRNSRWNELGRGEIIKSTKLSFAPNEMKKGTSGNENSVGNSFLSHKNAIWFRNDAFGSFPISFHFLRRFGCEECVNIFHVSFYTQASKHIYIPHRPVLHGQTFFISNGVNVILIKV